MQLVYDGIISQAIADYCRNATKEYTFAVEVSIYPDHEWMAKYLADHEYYTARDMQGNSEKRLGKRYCLVQKDFGDPNFRDSKGVYTGGGFIFLKYEEDYMSVLTNWGLHVIKSRPFTTII